MTAVQKPLITCKQWFLIGRNTSQAHDWHETTLRIMVDKAMHSSHWLIDRRSRTASIRYYRTATKVRIRTETVNRLVLSDVSAPVSGMNIRHLVRSWISQECRNIGAHKNDYKWDWTPVRNEPQAFKALKSRQSLSGGKTFNHSPLQLSNSIGQIHIVVWMRSSLRPRRFCSNEFVPTSNMKQKWRSWVLERIHIFI